ncbi:MAG: MBL fold metallo-hydrolase [Planctomycetota bacterium]
MARQVDSLTLLIQPFCSGSSGNCLFVRAGDISILIDAGLTGDRLEEHLQSHGIAAESLAGIVLTHLHGDHLGCAGKISRRQKVTVFASDDGVKSNAVVGRLKKLSRFHPGDVLEFNQLRVFTIPISHDAPGTVACVVEYEGARFGIATDLGRASDRVAAEFYRSNGFLLEFNHSETALRDGAYPWRLKRRVLSEEGHLSNEQAAEMLQKSVGPTTKTVLLGHLSEHNNDAAWALAAARGALATIHRNDVDVLIAPRGELGPALSF